VVDGSSWTPGEYPERIGAKVLLLSLST
jgi:hypothetical protein